jgi:hypothetical protein
MPTPRIRTLRRAAQDLGGMDELARALGVSLTMMDEWLSDAGYPDDKAYFAALDIVARRSFLARRNRNTTSRARAAKVTPYEAQRKKAWLIRAPG